MSEWDQRTERKREKAQRAGAMRRERERQAGRDEMARELAKLRDPLKQGEIFERAPLAPAPEPVKGVA